MSKLNPKQERFAQEYHLDHNATKAAQRAGYSAKSAHVTAARMLKDPNILARVRELDAFTAAAIEITKEALLKSLWEDYTAARKQERPGPAVWRIPEAIAKLQGWNVEAPKTLRVIRSIQDLTDDELDAVIAAGRQDGATTH